MRVLGIDTSTKCGSLGIIDGTEVVAEYLIFPVDTHSTHLMPALQALIKSAKMDVADIDAFAVSLGPGSFTGLRVGLSTAKGFALATAKPVTGIPTLDALAHNLFSAPHLICPLLDARKGEVYAALYEAEGVGSLKRLTPYQALTPNRLPEIVPQHETIFLGNAVCLCREQLMERLGRKALFAPPHLGFPRGSAVAELGLHRLEAGHQDDVASLVPMYVRPSDAELHWRDPETNRST